MSTCQNVRPQNPKYHKENLYGHYTLSAIQVSAILLHFLCASAPSVCTYVTIWKPVNGFAWNLIFGESATNGRRDSILTKPDHSNGRFKCRHFRKRRCREMKYNYHVQYTTSVPDTIFDIIEQELSSTERLNLLCSQLYPTVSLLYTCHTTCFGYI
jgi:hypothetical protein